MKAFDSIRRAAGFEQMERANQVRMDEIARPANRSIDVGFSGEMDDMRNFIRADGISNRSLIAQVSAQKYVFRILFNAGQIFEMTGIGKAVQIQQALDLWTVDCVMNKI